MSDRKYRHRGYMDSNSRDERGGSEDRRPPREQLTMEEKIQRHLLGVPGNLKRWVEGPAGNRYRTLTAKK